MKKETILGLVLTFLWVSAFFYFAFDRTIEMRPNEWGDFLAGLTAPLALLWLVLGYFQQGRELRLNTEALQLQQEELKHQVEATLHLAEQTNRQADTSERLEKLTRLDHEREINKEIREAQPSFFPHGGRSGNAGNIITDIVNNGSEVFDIAINHKHLHGMEITPLNRWEKGQMGQLTITQGNSPIQYPINFTLSYTDKLGTRYTKQFEFTGAHEFSESPLNTF